MHLLVLIPLGWQATPACWRGLVLIRRRGRNHCGTQCRALAATLPLATLRVAIDALKFQWFRKLKS